MKHLKFNSQHTFFQVPLKKNSYCIQLGSEQIALTRTIQPRLLIPTGPFISAGRNKLPATPVTMNYGYYILSVKTSHSVLQVSKIHSTVFKNRTHSILPVPKNHGYRYYILSVFKNPNHSILPVHMNHGYCILSVRTSNSILPVSKIHSTVFNNQTHSILPVPMNHDYSSLKTSNSILPVSKIHSTVFNTKPILYYRNL